MIDLHTHTIFSDGELIPSELVRRAEYKGLKGIAITDHGDLSNIDFIIPRIINISNELNKVLKIKVIPGIELTHVPPPSIEDAVIKSRDLGARLVVMHGETIAEPVSPGTNKAAILASVDILAHPGLITEDEVELAVKKNVYLEITARKGHSLTNGHVARLAKKIEAKLVINTDTHSPSDLIDASFAQQVVKGAGLHADEFKAMQNNAMAFF